MSAATLSADPYGITIAQVTGLNATGGDRQIALTWNPATNATGYSVERSPDGSTSWAVVGTPAGTSFTNTGLSDVTTYYYRVRGTNGTILGPYSTIAHATTTAHTLILDQFIDANGTLLNAHVIGPTNTPSTVWTNRRTDTLCGSGQNMTIQGNACQSNLSDNPLQYSLDAGAADVTITCDFNIASVAGGSQCGLLFRRQDANNWWTVQYQKSTGTLNLYETSGGSAALQATSTPGILSSFTLKVVLSGSSIDASIGSTHTTFTSSDFAAATQHGLRCDNGVNVSYDNFQVTSP